MKKKIFGEMEWFRVSDQPASFNDIPKEFKEAYDLWEEDSKANLIQVVTLIYPYVNGLFVAQNIRDWEELFVSDDLPEFSASSVTITGIDFRSSPLPLCKVEAEFEVPVVDNFDSIDIDAWLEEKGALLSDCLSFFWDLPYTDSIEDLDLFFSDHNGAEAWVVAE